MINSYEIIYTGGKLDAIQAGVLSFVWPITGTLKNVWIKCNAVSSGSTSYFNIQNNGSPLWAGTSRLGVSSGTPTAEKDSLAISVTKRQSGRLDLDSLAAGNITGPIYLTLEIDDGIDDVRIVNAAFDASAEPNYPAADAGHLLIVSVGGKIGGASGATVSAGDQVLCLVDASAAGNEATVGANWNIISASGGGGAEELDDLTDVDTSGVSDGDVLAYDNGTSTWKPATAGTGDVTGPASSTDNDIATFDSTTGKIIQDSGVVISTDGAFTANSDAKVPTEKAVKTYADGLKLTESMGIAVSDESTNLATGTSKVTFRMPYAFTLTEVRANVNTAPTGSTIIVDINEGGSTILSTKLSIDASEKTSTTAASAAVISDASLADDAELTIDIDQVGSSTPGKGLKVWLIGHKT